MEEKGAPDSKKRKTEDGAAVAARAEAPTADPSRDEHVLKIGDGSSQLVMARKPWESRTAFTARVEWAEGARTVGIDGLVITTDTIEEAKELDRLSALWYNIRYLGCTYHPSMMERVGNPEPLVKTQPKKQMSIGSAVHAMHKMVGTRKQGFEKGARPPGVRLPPGIGRS